MSVAEEKLLPHSKEAEIGMIGCLILDTPQCIGMCVDKITKGAEVFYDFRHGAIYDAILECYERNPKFDILILQQHLKDKKQLDQIGGISFLAAAMNSVPSAANLEYYLDIVLEKYTLRRMIQVCTGCVARIYDYQGEVKELLDQTGREIIEACETGAPTKRKLIKDLVHGAINEIEARHQGQGKPRGLSTGFPDLDKMTSGLHGGEMIVIAARPSLGKSSLMMNIVDHIAVEEKIPVGVFSLEMSAESLVLRMICSRARVNLQNISDGFLAERDFPKLTGAAGKVANAPIYIDDTDGLSILQLRSKARQMYQQFGIKFLAVDYLQLLNAISKKIENRQQEISAISKGIKSIAKELGIPVMVLAQLNRELDKDKNRKPRLSDLRESGAIEQDADLIGLLYKPNKKDAEDEPEPDASPTNLLIAKQRNGPTGDVHLMFLKSITRFESASRVADVPSEAEDRPRYKD